MQNGIIFDNTFQLNLVRVDGNTQNIQEIGWHYSYFIV
jgi:hypothetical protein